jgi:oligopeptide transport system substrate-binding protein
VLTAASALGRRFALPLLEGVLEAAGAGDSLHELQRLGLLEQSRRWPQPEFRFRHALIQETAYRTLLGVNRARLHRRAAEWLEERYGGREDEVLGLLAHHWLAAENEDKAVDYLLRAGDKARQEYALDEAVDHYRALLRLLEQRGEDQASALVLFKLALAFHTSLRFADANSAYARALDRWQEPAGRGAPAATLRMTTSFLPVDADPTTAIAWPNIQLCMQLFDRLVVAWPERAIVPSLAERWEIADDGLRYVFHLREGLTWSDGVPLTAHDVEFGIKRVLDPRAPGSSVAIYFVLEQGEATYLGENRDWDAVGVRALDDLTVEFRLAAPAPYFMSVMNRPDGGPQPRHAIEEHGAEWTALDRQVVSGAFRRVEETTDGLVLERRDNDARPRIGNVRRVELQVHEVPEGLRRFKEGAADLVAVRYTPRKADLAASSGDAVIGHAGWSGYFAFDHTQAPGSSLDFRRALAHAVDREALAAVLPSNLVVATGGIVPPALQGHTPDVAPRFDPELARAALERSGTDRVSVEAAPTWDALVEVVVETWRETLDIAVERVDAGGDVAVRGWLPGYPDPEYYLRLLFQSTSRTNEGGFADPEFDALIERARQERGDRGRLERFHEADRFVVAERIGVIPLVYGRSMAIVRPGVTGWWEFGKTSVPFADLQVR